MFKRVLGCAVLALSGAASHAATSAPPQWAFSFTGFEDVGYTAFDPTIVVSGSFSGADNNGDGAITESELTGFRFEGTDFFACSAGGEFRSCDPPLFSYIPGQEVMLNLFWGINDACCNHIRTFQTGDQLFYNNVYEGIGHYRVWRFTPQTQFQIAAVPEPQTWSMALAGALMVGAMVRRTKRRSHSA